MYRANIKEEAIRLRKLGYSYQQIHDRLAIPQGTCSAWLSGIKLSKKALLRLEVRSIRGRSKGIATMIARRDDRDRKIEASVIQNLYYISFDKSLCALLCSMLYWGEGAKRSSEVRFMNSDPVMIKTFLYLFRKAFDIDETKLRARLHLHSYHDIETQKNFWSKISAIPTERISIHQKANSGKIKRIGYPGCISINYCKVNVFKTLTSYYLKLPAILGA